MLHGMLLFAAVLEMSEMCFEQPELMPELLDHQRAVCAIAPFLSGTDPACTDCYWIQDRRLFARISGLPDRYAVAKTLILSFRLSNKDYAIDVPVAHDTLDRSSMIVTGWCFSSAPMNLQVMLPESAECSRPLDYVNLER